METRKHIPRATLARIYFIEREIASGKYPNVNDLAQKYECGTATIDYKGIRDTEENARLVQPYQLLFDTGIWYLYGYSEEREAMRLFSLQRMKNAALTNETFNLPEDFDYNAKNNNSHFGVFEGEKQNYRIQFSNDVFPEIEERQWAVDQKMEYAEDDYFSLVFSSTQFDKVLSWVLSFGCFAAPVEPPQLVEVWEWHI